MRGRIRIAALIFVAGFSSTASAQSQRLKDEDLRELMEEAKNDVERFTDEITPQYRSARIKTATTEVVLDGFLKDLKKNAETMRERFKEDYSSGREVMTFLRQASAIEDRSARGGGLFGAEKEWPRLRGTLGRLSREYGIDWSTSPENWVAMRMNDRDLSSAIEKFKKTSESFKKSLESALPHMTNVPKEERKNVMTAIDRLSGAADDLKDAAEDGREGSRELQRLTASSGDVQSFLEKYGLSGSVGSTFRMLSTDLSTVAGAFH